MSKSDRQLADQRAARNLARAEFNRRLAQARVDLAPAVLKRRAVAEAQRTALSAAHQAIDIANDSRGVVAATVAALMLWYTRRPIMAGAGKLLHRFQNRKAARRSLGDRIKLLTGTYWQRLKEYADE
jgi:hypothetical protein